MKFILFFSLLFTANIFAQVKTDLTISQKWGKVNYSYKIQDPPVSEKRDYSLEGENTSGIILKSFADIYWFFISDVDGDNCSFSPTCSSFFIKSAKKTNILQGTLMFADRFTRDLNLFKINHYPRVKDGHFYDPVYLYTLNKKNIIIIPTESVVNGE
jgi:putative component of membrane protein insertase Oxa1/YidC/SpoIIIJ protein YidD